ELDHGDKQNRNDHRHLSDPKPAQPLEDDGPRVDEAGLNVEDDEEHRGQIEADRKAPSRAAARDDARFIRKILGGTAPATRQPGGKEEGNKAENEDGGKKNEQGKIVAEHGTRLV